MIEIDFIGYSATHSYDFGYEIREGLDCYLLLLITSPAELLIHEEYISVSPNTLILYTPGNHIAYRAAEGECYSNDWLRFYTDETFVTQFPYTNTPFHVKDPDYCHSLFQLLTWESSFPSANSEVIIADLLRILFSKLHESTSDTPVCPHTHALLDLHKKIYNNPQLPWNIQEMAENLHLSTSRLHTLYKQLFGISCMDDVIQGRLRLAKDQLGFSSKSVREIADYCGYNNVEHFCRQFKKLVGCTPGQYRNSEK